LGLLRALAGLPGPTGWKRVIDVSVAATVIAACVGAAAVLVGAYLTNSLGRRLKQGVQERRLAAYEGLWAVTGVAATIRLRGEWAGGPLTENERRELFDAMTKWYYRTSGGIFLSPRARPVYLKAKVNLLCPETEIEPAEALADFPDARTTEEARGRLAIRQLSLLRWVMRFDLSIHTEPYNAYLMPMEIEFLRRCEIDLHKRPFKDKWRSAKENANAAPGKERGPASLT
jgi:hypothetical protein